MRVVILEDEAGAARNLLDILREIDPGIEVMAILESVREAVSWFDQHPTPDLGFFDIRLADGESFEVFEKVRVEFPVVFTTAYDEYALAAFKVNSIDYLLKPVGEKELRTALEKYINLYGRGQTFDPESIRSTLRDVRQQEEKQYKKNFLVYVQDQIIPVAMDQIAYFFIDNERVRCMTHQHKKYLMDQTLDKIGAQVDPNYFFRANRQFIISRKSVLSAAQHFHRKLKLRLSPPADAEVLISKTKAAQFKAWLES
jgi:DNA-binding LytR/AlgR family response regulator